MRERIVLIGAGSAVFTRGLLADLVRSADVALVDIDERSLEVAVRLAEKMVEARSGAHPGLRPHRQA